MFSDYVISCDYTDSTARFVLDGRSDRIKVYPAIYNLSSSLGVVESRYVSDEQIISNLWSIIHAFKRNNSE